MNSSVIAVESLMAEKLRLEKLLEEQKLQLKTDFSQLKEQLEPTSRFLNTGSFFTGKKAPKNLLNIGLGLGLDLLVGNTLFKKAGFITKTAVPFLLRTVTENLTNGKGNRILHSIGNLFSKKNNPVKA